jgi:glycosyltransferase involved in cell wall biosynthesis
VPAVTPLTVGIDARAAAEVPAGRGRVVRELLRSLAERDDGLRFVLYARERWEESLPEDRFRWELIGAPDPFWHVLAAARARRDDVFLSTNSYLTAWFLRPSSVVFVYDLVPWIPDAAAQKRAARIERATIRLGIRRAASLMCISEATRQDLEQRFPAARGKAFVAPLAADARFFAPHGAATLERFALERPFVLAAGTLEPRKNLPRLFEAYSGLPEKLRAAHELVVVGPEGWEMADSLRAAKTHADDVRLLGHVSDDELAALYGACAVFGYPSLYEGFGLPVLEAMAAGAAVLTSNVSSLPEVGGDAVAYCDPQDVGSIRAGLADLLGDADRRARLGASARERAKTFSWDAFAARIVDAARTAAERRR